MDVQPRLTDLVPLRLPVFLIPLILGGAIIAGLEALYVWMPQLAAMTTDGRIAAFDLDGEGSLAVWFSTTMLSAAAITAVLVYLVRRHRVDDYHGHYRVWLWAAMCWFLMGLDETASLHEGFKELMAAISGTRLFGDGSIWWVMPYFFLLGAVGTRLLVDMRHSRLSSATFLLAAISYAVGVVAQLGWIMPESGARGVMVEEGAEMLGNLLLLVAMALHARYVIMDAEGLLELETDAADEPEPRHPDFTEWPSRNHVSESAAETGSLRDIAVHPPHGIPRPAAAVVTQPARPTPLRIPVVPSTVSDDDDDEDLEDPSPASPVNRKLTKEERRALRKRLAKMKKQRQSLE